MLSMFYKSNFLPQIFALDLRSLSLMRILSGFTLMLDSFLRLQNLVPHYTDIGVLPRDAIINNQDFFLISIYFISGSPAVIFTLFTLQILFGFLLMIGFKTRMISLICWLMFLSAGNRNPYVNASGDVLFNITLFWGIFLPWNTYFSVDSILKKTSTALSNSVTTISTTGYFLQILIMYFFNGLYKLNYDWIIAGNGVYYALKYLPFQQSVGDILLSHPLLLKILSYITVAFELLIPFLLLFPYNNRLVRSLTLFALLLMHISFGLAIELGLFSWFVIISLIGLLPDWGWSKINFRFKFFYKTKFFSKFTDRQRSSSSSSFIEKNFAIKLLLILLIIYIFFINLVGYFNLYRFIPSSLFIPSKLIAFHQKWNLFTPPPKESLWIIAEGTLEDGKTIKIIGDKEQPQPEYPIEYFSNHHWKKLSTHIAQGKYPSEFAQYLCRSEKPSLASVQLYRHQSTTQLDGTYLSSVSPIDTYQCNAGQTSTTKLK